MMNDDDLIAYEGAKFTIEWYRDSADKSSVHDYFMELDERQQDKIFLLFLKMGDFGRISDKAKFNHEGDQIYAFKPQPNRFLCFFQKGKKIIVTNAFHKKQQKIPKCEKERSVNCREDYLERSKKGEYYHVC